MLEIHKVNHFYLNFLAYTKLLASIQVYYSDKTSKFNLQLWQLSYN